MFSFILDIIIRIIVINWNILSDKRIFMSFLIALFHVIFFMTSLTCLTACALKNSE